MIDVDALISPLTTQPHALSSQPTCPHPSPPCRAGARAAATWVLAATSPSTLQISFTFMGGGARRRTWRRSQTTVLGEAGRGSWQGCGQAGGLYLWGRSALEDLKALSNDCAR